jgi:hypothetical protein
MFIDAGQPFQYHQTFSAYNHLNNIQEIGAGRVGEFSAQGLFSPSVV